MGYSFNIDWTDQDVEKATRHVLERHGAGSQVRARKQAHELKNGGQAELAAVWERIADAIVRATSPQGILGLVPLQEG